MSTHFQSVEVRSNGGTVVSGWWNSLRTAGIALESIVNALVGAGASTSEATFAIANNQSGANVTGLIASNLYRVTRIRYWVRRLATDTVMESGELIILYDGTNFHLGRHSVETAITAGMSFDVNASTGQVTYSSSNMAGSYDTVNSLLGYSRTTQGTI